MALKWEKLNVAEPKHEFIHGALYRSPVPGGWLMCCFWTMSGAGGPSISFYPDPEHVWDGSSLDYEDTAEHPPFARAV
jgi:hypothetical protein